MSTVLALPESYRFYMDAQNAESIAYITKQRSIPPSLEWNEVVDYNKARFALAIMKHEYYLFLCDAWKATWGAALNTQKERFYPIKSDEYAIGDFRPKDWLSPEAVWDEAFYCILKARDMNENMYIVTTIELDENNSLCIGFSLTDYDEGKQYANTVSLDENLWNDAEAVEDGEGFIRYAKVEAGPDEHEKITVVKLREAAEVALEALKDADALKR